MAPLETLSDSSEEGDDALTRRQFVAARRKQDSALHQEFANLHDKFDSLHDKFDRKFEEVDARFEKVDVRFDEIDARFKTVDDRFDEVAARFNEVDAQLDEIKADYRRMDIASYHSRLRNPTFALRPMPVYRPGTGLVYPDAFPRTAKAFFGLRLLQSEADQRLLVYLVQFYDIEDWVVWSDHADDVDEQASDEEASDSDGGQGKTLEDATLRYPHLAVDALSLTLGLDEDRFIDFRERAAAYASAREGRPPIAIKRNAPADDAALDEQQPRKSARAAVTKPFGATLNEQKKAGARMKAAEDEQPARGRFRREVRSRATESGMGAAARQETALAAMVQADKDRAEQERLRAAEHVDNVPPWQHLMISSSSSKSPTVLSPGVGWSNEPPNAALRDRTRMLRRIMSPKPPERIAIIPRGSREPDSAQRPSSDAPVAAPADRAQSVPASGSPAESGSAAPTEPFSDGFYERRGL